MTTADTEPVLAAVRAHFARGEAARAEALLRAHADQSECAGALRDYLVTEQRADEALAIGEPVSDPLFKALQQHLAGQFAQARETCRSVLAGEPDNPSALLHLARAAHNLGHADEALQALRRAVEIRPDFAEGWHALAHALRAGDELRQACECYGRALEHSPGLRQARMNLGLTRFNMDDAEGALACFDRLLKTDPDDAGALMHSGLALHLLGHSQPARERLSRALAQQPDHPEANRFLATVLNEAGEAQAAIGHLERALAARPDDPELYAELAAIHELSSDLEKLEAVVERGLGLTPGHPGLNLERARLDRRRGEAESALGRLERMDARQLPPRLAQQYFHELGLCLDRLQRPDPAFEAFATANRISAGNPKAQAVDREAYFRQLQALESWLERRSGPPAPEDDPAGEDLCFLIGFPRSGTTLIDTMLDAHPEVDSIEEKPTLEQVIARLRRQPQGYPQALAAIDRRQADELRALYRRTAADYLPDRSARVVVDKLPLRLLHVELIRLLFPAARCLFMQRHPCDVVLSNFMQLYDPNEAFVHCDTLASTVRFYDATMRLWRRLQPLAGDRLLQVRYEDLIEAPESWLDRVCGFLEIERHEAMLDADRRTAGRGRIRTTSYQQVTESLYRHAAGRWQRYRRHLEPWLETLEPHARAMNYTLE